jgi:hypothetical protein
LLETKGPDALRAWIAENLADDQDQVLEMLLTALDLYDRSRAALAGVVGQTVDPESRTRVDRWVHAVLDLLDADDAPSDWRLPQIQEKSKRKDGP